MLPGNHARALAALRKREMRTCERCGASFEAVARKSPVRYCSARGRQAAWINANREQDRARRRDNYRRKKGPTHAD
jgi:ribosomal protein L34E